jgi:hypothetical protein
MSRTPTRRIAIVARRIPTLNVLRSYLHDRGFRADTWPAIDARLLRQRPRAVVLFPDEFRREAVARFVARLRRSFPSVRLVLVTSDPRHSAASATSPATSGARRGSVPVVLARPSFGWTIVDAVCGRELGA